MSPLYFTNQTYVIFKNSIQYTSDNLNFKYYRMWSKVRNQRNSSRKNPNGMKRKS